MSAVNRSKSNWMLSVKVLLVSVGVVSIAVVLKLSVPLILDFAVYGVPVIWISVLSWMKPPYLYIVFNFIIIAVAALSQLCHKQEEQHQAATIAFDGASSEFVFEEKKTDFTVTEVPAAVVLEQIEFEGSVEEVVKTVVNEEEEVKEEEVKEEEEEYVIPRSNWSPLKRMNSSEEEEYVIPRSNWSPLKRMNSSEIPLEISLLPSEKPPVSARFTHRKPVKSSPEGEKALKVTKAKRQDTFESTWKMITDGRHVPLTRHLRKSDTWENRGRQINAPQQVTKSETLKDRTNNPPAAVSHSPSSGKLSKETSLNKLKKEASLGQEELNRRVEAFIKKFNEDMRLQRQESLNQYKEMINRGAY